MNINAKFLRKIYFCIIMKSFILFFLFSQDREREPIHFKMPALPLSRDQNKGAQLMKGMGWEGGMRLEE